jgi:hypothetical protein
MSLTLPCLLCSALFLYFHLGTMALLCQTTLLCSALPCPAISLCSLHCRLRRTKPILPMAIAFVQRERRRRDLVDVCCSSVEVSPAEEKDECLTDHAVGWIDYSR